MSRIFVLGTAAIFFVYGLLFFLFPMETFKFVVDGAVTSSSGVTDMRASYGGMSAGIGVIMFLLATNPQTIRMGLVSVFVVMFGMAFGRFLGIVIDGNANSYMYVYLGLEIAASLVALVLMRLESKK